MKKLKDIVKNDTFLFISVLAVLMSVAYFRNYQGYKKMKELQEASMGPVPQGKAPQKMAPEDS